MTKTPKSWQKKHTELHRFGFNGKENDNEVKGTGNQQDYGARIYDPRIGRFLSADPLERSFPWWTPYQFAGNMPIYGIDLDGREVEPAIIKKSTEPPFPVMGIGNKWDEIMNSYTVTIMQTSHRLQGFVEKDPLEYADIAFYYLQVQFMGQTRIFRTNFGPLTICSDGTGPAHGSSSQNSGALASGVTVNADETPYYITGCELKQNGFSQYFSRVFVWGINLNTNQFVESAANTLESGCNPDNSTDHASNELSVLAAWPFVGHKGLCLKDFNLNKTPYNRNNYTLFYAEELGTGGNSKSWATLSGADFELSRKFLQKGFDALNSTSKGTSTPAGVIVKKEPFSKKKVKDAVDKSNKSRKNLIIVSPRHF